MTASDAQISANRTNAEKSTGPVSIDRKLTSSANATRHGLFSKRALIDGESQEEFDTLIAELQSSLSPAGPIEASLVEKIALNMWRQRRLANAEAAAIRLQRRLPKVARTVSTELYRGFGNELKPKDLVPFDGHVEAWCRNVLNEYEKLDEIDPVTLPKVAPLIHAQLRSDAEEDFETIEDTYGVYEDGLTGYVGNLVDWCRKQIKAAEKRPSILAVAEQVRARSQVLDDKQLELMSRYQTTLDNQLYKTMKALRDAQEWRLKALDGTTVAGASEQEN